MKEAELNTIIRNSLIDRSRFGYKISDVGGGQQQRRPFDGLGVFDSRVVFWEAKIAKGVKAFNLCELFDGERGHQMDTFESIKQETVGSQPRLWVVYGCSIPRNTRVYIFDYDLLRSLYKEQGVKSLHKKDLDTYLYNSISKKRLASWNINYIGQESI